MNFSKNILVLFRQLNVTSVRHASVIKPPVPVFGVEGRYATALYSAAMKEKKIDAVEKDMIDLKNLLAKDVKLNEFILNPLTQIHLKVDVLKKVFAKKNFSPLTLNVIVCMAENRRLKSLNSVINCFNGVMSNIRGEVICEIVSAKNLATPMRVASLSNNSNFSFIIRQSAFKYAFSSQSRNDWLSQRERIEVIEVISAVGEMHFGIGLSPHKGLDAPTLAEFEKTLKKFLKKNEKVILQTTVDPSLIGGVVVTIGDKYIDMSIASKIKAYNSVLREIV